MSYSGNTLAFQAKARGSIPLIRFNYLRLQPERSPSAISKANAGSLEPKPFSVKYISYQLFLCGSS